MIVATKAFVFLWVIHYANSDVWGASVPQSVLSVSKYREYERIQFTATYSLMFYSVLKAFLCLHIYHSSVMGLKAPRGSLCVYWKS